MTLHFIINQDRGLCGAYHDRYSDPSANQPPKMADVTCRACLDQAREIGLQAVSRIDALDNGGVEAAIAQLGERIIDALERGFASLTERPKP